VADRADRFAAIDEVAHDFQTALVRFAGTPARVRPE
jgi:hypothetical protein